jgi:tetratricopeptide (TPR) repeat protein
MSSLITKASKRGSSASQKIRATKGKKSPSRKPQRPGRITAAPKAKKVAAGKKLSQPKKAKKATPVKKAAARPVKKVAVKKKALSASAKKTKVNSAKKTAVKRATSKSVATRSQQKKPDVRKVLARRVALIPKPLPAPPKKPPSPGTLAAVKAFEQALRSFNRHDFSGAKSAFVGVLAKFADQSEIVARVRTYLVICEQRLSRSPSLPRNPEALYDQGVFQFNKGNSAEAIELFQKALKVEPRADHVYYSLAAAYARLDDTQKAMEALRRAIGISPVHRSHARRDLDFVGLRVNEDFQQLTGFGFDLVED